MPTHLDAPKLTTRANPLAQWVFETQSTPTLLCGALGDIVWCNPAACAALGVSERQLLGTAVAHWLSPRDVLVEMIAQVASNPGHPLKLDVFNAKARTVDASSDSFQAALAGTEHHEAPVLIELLNHAPALRAQAAAHLSAQQSAQRELLRNLAHEIRNPLGGIRGAAQLLAKASKDTNSHEYTDVIVAEASRLQALLDRLLSAQAAPHTRSQMNVHEMLERVRSIVAAEYPQGLAWRRDYDISLPELWADEHQLVQVFLNLMRNAAQIMLPVLTQGDTTCPKNPPCITLKSRALRQITVGSVRHKLALELLVIDNGPGIPEFIKPHLFSPLVTHRQGGTGLGLHIAQSFVQQHGGMIEAESSPSGTAFRVVLPLG